MWTDALRAWFLTREEAEAFEADPRNLAYRAAIYSLIGTAKLNGIDPESYLRNVLSRIAEHPINHIEGPLPWNLAADLPEDSRQAA